jgi:lipoic acid synthetase
MKDTPVNKPNPLKGKSKTARIPIKVVPSANPLKKPKWIRARAPNSPEALALKEILRAHNLNTVCEEAACPNLGECFTHGTATFMILGQVCTRRCPFCDVAHGKPGLPDLREPAALAETIAAMKLNYVVITSVDRDDLRDGGASHFASCIGEIRNQAQDISIEILVPDFRGRLDKALDNLAESLPDVLNHNLETIPRLYKKARPGADYSHSLSLLSEFKKRFPGIPTKSGLMVGLGETDNEIIEVMHDLREHDCDMLTIGQYLQPGEFHLPVERYVHPDVFAYLAETGRELGFTNVASGPMVRSSYHADQQASKQLNKN